MSALCLPPTQTHTHTLSLLMHYNSRRFFFSSLHHSHLSFVSANSSRDVPRRARYEHPPLLTYLCTIPIRYINHALYIQRVFYAIEPKENGRESVCVTKKKKRVFMRALPTSTTLVRRRGSEGLRHRFQKVEDNKTADGGGGGACVWEGRSMFSVPDVRTGWRQKQSA